MPRIIVTAGKDYLDIDAYAGIVAYAELLRQLGEESIAVSSAPFNSSITPTQQKLDVGFTRTYQPRADDTFVVVDLSDPEYFDTLIAPERVVGVIDHHVGHESYWQERIGKGASIEFIGAACTLVVEQWKQHGKLDTMPPAVAELLAAGIIDNTLNFKATLTTPRDHAAYAAVCSVASLDADWAESYLKQCQEYLLQDFPTALANDTKLITYPDYRQPVAVGQLMALNAQQIIDTFGPIAKDLLTKQSDSWYLNILDMRQGVSCFYTTHQPTKLWLEKVLAVEFDDDIAVAKRLWLRKEIFKEATNEQ